MKAVLSALSGGLALVVMSTSAFAVPTNSSRVTVTALPLPPTLLLLLVGLGGVALLRRDAKRFPGGQRPP